MAQQSSHFTTTEAMLYNDLVYDAINNHDEPLRNDGVAYSRKGRLDTAPILSGNKDNYEHTN